MILPPYGIFSEEYKIFLDKDPSKPMEDWNKKYNPGADVADRWEGAAIDFADEASEIEIKIMMRCLQANPDKGGRQSSILKDFPTIDPNTDEWLRRDHEWHFKVEEGVIFGLDTDAKIPGDKPGDALQFKASKQQGSNYFCYNSRIDPDVFHQQFYDDLHLKLNGLFDFKAILNRPRPYQAADIFGLNDFVHHVGSPGNHKGMSPSMISGHCLQGILLSCKALELWLDGGKVEQSAYDSLQHYAVDFGDRRVFGGVHYPSDNIASWVLSIKIIPYIFRHADEILAFAKNAIKNKSVVYTVIQNEFSSHKALRPSLGYLNQYIT